jgi:glutaredoxin|tara:strand:+ start:905 stop:1201 length:297 start_codon:yes stop_codon:yes gene_type:complete
MVQTAIKNIVVYTKKNCLYCSKAKALIKGLGFSFTEKNFETDFKSIEDLFEDIGKQVRAMPQIKIDGELIGGYNQLIEYFEDRELVNFKGEITNANAG